MSRERPPKVVTPVTPLPIRKIAVLGLILTANNISIWMIFSFLPFMVANFFPELSTSELGYKAGIMGSAFSVGGLLGNVIWGTVSDRIGRRPALLAGLFGTALSSLCFGFSPTFWFAVASRFMWGLLNGNIGVAKTYLAEVCDDTNSAKGMALFGVIGGVGRTIGPVIGGFLSSPAENYPSVFKGTLFDTFPYALPALIVFFNCIAVLIVAYFELSETLPSKAMIRLRAESIDNSSNNSHSEPESPSDHLALLSESHDAAASPTKHGVPLSFSLPTVVSGGRFSQGQGYRKLTTVEEQEEDTYNAIQNSTNSNGLELKALKINPISTNSSSNSPPRAGPKRKKSLTFSNVVQVMVIGSKSLAYSQLKQISRDETPVNISTTSNCNSSSSPRTPQSQNHSDGSDKIVSNNKRSGTPRNNNTNNTNSTNSNSQRNNSNSSGNNHADIESGLSIDDSSGIITTSVMDSESPTPSDESDTHNSPPFNNSSQSNSTNNRDVNGDFRSIFGGDSDSNPGSGNNSSGDNSRHGEGGGDECDSQKLLGGEEEFQGSLEGGVRYSNGSEFNESYLNSLKSISSNLGYLLTRREILVTTTMYGFCALALIMWNEVFPLWVVTSKNQGGFEYTSHTIGIATMITGVISIFTQVFIYPVLVTKLGVMNVYRIGVLMMGISCVIMPMLSLLVQVNEIFAFIMVVTVSTIANLCAAWAMICIFVLINNSCYSHQRATVNGIGQTFASLGRVMGPYLGGLSFAWSETNGRGWPINYYFCWYLLAALALWSFQLVNCLPRTIQRRKREPKFATYCGRERTDSNASLAVVLPTVRGSGGSGRGSAVGDVDANSV